MALKTITLLPDRVTNWNEYPFNVPAIASVREIIVRSPVMFFVGENGSGSTDVWLARVRRYPRPAHHWVFIFPFLGGVAAIWFALQPGPFYPRHRTAESRPTATRTVRAIYIPAGIVFSVVAAMHFRFPWTTDHPALRWSVLTLLAIIILRVGRLHVSFSAAMRDC